MEAKEEEEEEEEEDRYRCGLTAIAIPLKGDQITDCIFLFFSFPKQNMLLLNSILHRKCLF